MDDIAALMLCVLAVLITYRWMLKSWYWKEVRCPVCHGTGFNGRGTGYDDVCGYCIGGKDLVPTIKMWEF